MAEAVFQYVIKVVSVTFSQLIILIGPGLVLAMIMHFLGRFVEKQAYKFMGEKLFLWFFGWLGTSIHEIGHAVFHIIFRHKITEMQLFKPDPETNTLGHVSFRYNQGSLYQRIGLFFSGIGPILIGSLAIYLLSRFLLSADVYNSMKSIAINVTSISSFENILGSMSSVYHASISVLSKIFVSENLSRWQFYLFVYLSFCIGSSITLSTADIKNAFLGFITFVLTLLVFNVLTIWIGNFTVQYLTNFSKYYSFFYAIMIFVIVMNIMVAGILLPIGIITKSIRNRKIV